MATPIKFKAMLHSRMWEQKAIAPYGSGPLRPSRLHDNIIFSLVSASSFASYNTSTDAWCVMGSPALSTANAGTCVEHSAIGPSGTATAGTTTTITTNLSLAIGLAGYKIRLTGGPGAGDERTILSNTVGANSVITVSSPFSTAVTSSTTYTLLTGSLYMFGGGTVSATSFKKYDFATNSFTSLSTIGMPASFGTEGFLIGTPSIISNGVVTSLATGTATSATSTTLTNSAKTWTTNQWSNAYQVRITGGTGAGQTRAISSNTSTALTVASAWTTTPDATSTYSIEGNDDYLYLLGNGSASIYRYGISNGSWATPLSPNVARSGAITGSTWLVNEHPSSDWNNESNILNGRRIYSFRSSSIDYYDIALNAWTNSIPFGPGLISPTTGWKVATSKGIAYIRNVCTGALSCQIYAFDPARSYLDGFHTQPVLCQSTNSLQQMAVSNFVDGDDVVPYLYISVENSTLSNPLIRTPIL